MKKYVAMALALVLTMGVLTGCRRKQPEMTTTAPTTVAPTTMPTVAPTTRPTTAPTTAPTTEATTIPTTLPTQPSTDATIEDGNGPLSTDSTTATDETGMDNARSRSGGMIGSNGTMEGAGSGNGITGSITG